MRAHETKLNTLMQITDQQFVVPIYQRKYSWTEKQCLALWQDIIKLSERGDDAGHFIGSIVCYEMKTTYLPGELKKFLVIDGQQRITTLSLIMLSLIRAYEKMGDEGKRIAKSLKENFIVNTNFFDDDMYKLYLTNQDKETYIALVKGDENELRESSRQLLDNFSYFYNLLQDDETNLEKVYKGINKLDLVYIGLTANQDNPQLIFESMNSTGLNLSQGDLLRNFLLLDLIPEEQKDLYENYWRRIELDFGEQGYNESFDFFLRDYLTMKQKRIPKLENGYDEFKDYYYESGLTKREIMGDLRKFTKYYCRIIKCHDDSDLSILWRELKTQKVDVANPFLLRLYDDYESAKTDDRIKLSKDDFIEIIEAIISYVFRRYICGIPTNSLNKTFGSTLLNAINKEDYKNSVIATLVLLDSYKLFPTDDTFEKAFISKDIYTSASRIRNYTLEKLENHNHLNPIIIDGNDISIEHILPATLVLKKHWQEVLGDDWKNLQNEYVHTIGNLTLTKGVYNSQMSDKPFLEKINVPGGIKNSNYRLSNSVVDKTKWGIDEIKERGILLAKQALEIWKYPFISEEALKPYKNIKKEEQGYTDMNHYPKMDDKINAIYNQLDSRIMALNENIQRVYAKYYVAYKYDYNNFVEIIPYKRSLNIVLDIPFEDIKDEKGLVYNLAGKGHWGTGDCGIHITNDKDIDYIIEIIKQSLNNEKNG